MVKSSFTNLDSTFGVFEKESLQNIMGLAAKVLGPYEVMFGSPYLVFSKKTILVVLFIKTILHLTEVIKHSDLAS